MITVRASEATALAAVIVKNFIMTLLARLVIDCCCAWWMLAGAHDFYRRCDEEYWHPSPIDNTAKEQA
jgi:hypothetical protein